MFGIAIYLHPSKEVKSLTCHFAIKGFIILTYLLMSVFNPTQRYPNIVFIKNNVTLIMAV